MLRGRVFVPGVNDSAVNTDGTVNGNYINGLTAAAQALVDDATANWGVWHRPGPGGAGQFAGAISVSVWDKFAVLRSRRD